MSTLARVLDSAGAKISFKTYLLCSAAVVLLASPAQANPVGGAVTSGSASIASTGSKATVDQKSEDVVIEWSSFNIASGQTTQFVQPNAQAIAINRIGSANASRVLGTLDANGNVVLINGNGILFGKGAQVDVGALIATTTNGSDSDVLAGKFTTAGNQNASVINKGTITTASRGMVALVAPNVSNTGIVKAKLGTVSLGSANAFTVDFKGDGLVSFVAGGGVDGPASVVNTGRVVGANVSMTANAAEGIATSVISAGGVIRAEAAHQVGGTILLDAGNGTLTTFGTIDAAGRTGGAIETSGANVEIAGTIKTGRGGKWTVDPDDLTVDSAAATTIDNSLNGGTSVELQTTASGTSGPGTASSGLGDINIDSALSWSTGATLTLDAYHSINVNAPINITGAGNLALQYNDEATDGVLSFGLSPTGFAGNVSYGATNNGGTLAMTTGGVTTDYTLLYSMTDVQNINSNLSGDYALADSLDASGVTGWAPIGESTAFTGAFDGLGNIISNLTMSSSTPNTGLGMFGVIRAPGIVENFGLIGGSVSTSATGIGAGELAGYNDGFITNAYATGWVTGNGSVQYLGGLVGGNEGTITNGYATGAVTNSNNGNDASDIGGLAGTNGGAVANSYASGTVLGGSNVDAGGLIGSNSGTIANAYATGTATITGNNSIVGGLVGSSNYQSSTIMDAYATGAVSATASDDGVGGLSGVNDGTITDAYAIGTVTANGSNTGVGGLIGMNGGAITESFATGAVSGGLDSSIGGLVGINLQNTIADAYAAGAVNGTDASYIGGLVGSNDGKIVDTYAIGTVTDTGGGAQIGGLVGTNGKNISYSYWDTATSGQSTSAAGKGETTTELQAMLPNGFSSSAWSILPGVSFPYFSWQFAGTPQVVSGYVRNGAVTEPDMAVDLLVNGSEISPAIATTSGANGYFYLLLQPGAISAGGSNVLAYLAGAGKTGNAFEEDVTGSIADVVVKEGTLELNANAADSTALVADLDAAVGSNSGAQFLYTSAGGFESGITTILDDSAAAFTIDSALNLGAGTLVIDAAGQLDENASTGAITARVLSGKSVGGASLGGANLIQLLGAFTNTGAGGLTLADDRSLSVNGVVAAGTGDLQLTTTGAGSNIVISDLLSAGGTVTLDSSGAISEKTSRGLISADTLTGSAAGAVALGGANEIGTLDAFSGFSGSFALTDDQSLTVGGTIDFGTKNIALTTTEGDLTIDGALDGSTVTLVSDLGEVAGTGAITAKLLNVTADTGIDLTGSNDIKRIGTNHTNSGPDVINP